MIVKASTHVRTRSTKHMYVQAHGHLDLKVHIHLTIQFPLDLTTISKACICPSTQLHECFDLQV